MTSEQLAELVRGHANVGEDVAHRALGYVSPGMDWHGGASPIRVAHDVMAASDPRDTKTGALERLDYLLSRHGRDGARHETASYQKSGYVECQGQLVGYPELFDQGFQASAKVGDCIFLRISVAVCAHSRAEPSGGAPDAVLVLLNDVGHVNDSCHESSIACETVCYPVRPRDST